MKKTRRLISAITALGMTLSMSIGANAYSANYSVYKDANGTKLNYSKTVTMSSTSASVTTNLFVKSTTGRLELSVSYSPTTCWSYSSSIYSPTTANYNVSYYALGSSVTVLAELVNTVSSGTYDANGVFNG